MREINVVLAGLTAAALLAASASSAEARWWHRGPGPVAGLLGGIVVGAATIATLPFAVLADAARPGPPPRSYYGPDDYGYGPPPGYRGRDYGYGAYPPPPRYYARPYGPPPGYYRYGYGY